LPAASSDGGYGENNVGSFLVGGVGGANVYYYAVYCRTVYHSPAHRYEQVKEPTKQTDGGRSAIGHSQQR